MSIPREFTVNGVGRLSIAISHPGSGPIPLQENTLEFTALAFSIYAGLSILKKERGRETLAALGAIVVQRWESNHFIFGGDVSHMPHYVDEFLRAVERDFPRVRVSDIGGPEVIAEARRFAVPQWDGNLLRYYPKGAGGILFSLSKVTQMAAASQQGGNRNANERRMSSRYRDYLFMFAVATAHELTHLFIGYLAKGSDERGSYTPPNVTHLNYVGLLDENGYPASGESGRWLENRLFGGSVEFLRDVSDNDDQTGLPFLFDSQAMARRVDPNCVLRLLTRTQEFNEFPFITSGESMTFSDRQSRGLLSLGTTHASRPQRGTFMSAIQDLGQRHYSVLVSDLTPVPLEPGYILREMEVI